MSDFPERLHIYINRMIPSSKFTSFAKMNSIKWVEKINRKIITFDIICPKSDASICRDATVPLWLHMLPCIRNTY